MGEYGRVYSVETRHAGANVEGDHTAAESDLHVIYGWDFDEAGGLVDVDGDVLSYSSATFPPDDDDDIPVVLHLDAPLGVDVDDGVFARVVPGGEDKYATVEVAGQGAPVTAMVRHDLKPFLEDGIRGDESEAETVLVQEDSFGSWAVVDVPAKTPVMDGGFIDPDTLPPAPPQEPVVPPAVGKPTLKPMGLNALRASWTPVENPTPVMYDVYVAETTAFDPASAHFTTAASSVSFEYPWSNGVPLEPDTDYFVAVRSRSEDQLADWSPWSDAAQIVTVDLSGLDDLEAAVDELNDVTLPALQDEVDGILPITETDISDDAISTPKLQAGSITADKIGANEVVAGKIAADAVTANEIAADAVTAEQLLAGSVTADAIAANSVNASHVSANTIDGEMLQGTVILGSDISTATDGERHGLSAAEGHYSYGPDGAQVFQARGGNVRVDGDINARTLNVVDGATWSGTNLGAPNASTMMGNRMGPPGNAPSVENFWETVTLDGPDVVGDDPGARRGLVWHDNHWWVASRVESDPGRYSLAVVEFNADGSLAAVHQQTGTSGSVNAPASLTLLGSTLYVRFAMTPWALPVNPSTGAWGSVIILDGITVTAQDNGVLGMNGSNLLLAWVGSGGRRNCQVYDTSGNKVGAQFELNNGGLVPVGVLGGSFDFGEYRLVVSGPQNVTTFESSGLARDEYNGERFRTPGGSRGLAWDGSSFFSLTNDGMSVQKHTSSLKDEGLGADVDLHVASTWYDSDLTGGPHETAKSPSGVRTFNVRASYRLQSATAVPSGGGSDDPNGARFYVGRSPGRQSLELQGVDTPGAGGRASIVLDALDLPSGSGNADNPPPASGDFPPAVAYRHYSEAVDADGDSLVRIDGAGYAGGQGLRPVGEMTIWPMPTPPTAEWLVCDGSAISRTTYAKLYAVLGTTYGNGNGSSTFNIPDMRSRFPVGAGTYTWLSDSDQAAEANRSPAHDHASGSLTTGQPSDREENSGSGTQGAGPNHTHNVTGRTQFNLGPGAAVESQFPRLGVNFIIRAL